METGRDEEYDRDGKLVSSTPVVREKVPDNNDLNRIRARMVTARDNPNTNPAIRDLLTYILAITPPVPLS